MNALTEPKPDFLTHLALAAQSVPGGETIFTILMFIFVLGVLVFVHELGHFLAARSVGIRVDTFSIGFGPVLAKWRDKMGTQWQVAALPLGGYVGMLGEQPGKKLSKADEKHAFQNKSILQRAWVVIAGPAMNIVFAFILLFLVMLTGEHRLRPEVGETVAGMPAHNVLQPGDLITAFNGETIQDWDGFQKAVSANLGNPAVLSVARDVTDPTEDTGTQPQLLTITLQPQVTTYTDLLGDTHTVGRIGIAPSYATFVTQYPAHTAIARAASKTWELTALTVTSVYKLLIGAIAPDNLTGPLGIADMAGQTAANGLFAVAMFMVIISVNLAIVNLFPLPVLDGGHLVFLALEAIRGGKPVSARVQDIAMRIGLFFIIALALYATFNDVSRFGWLGGDKKEAAAEQPVQPQPEPAPAPVPLDDTPMVMEDVAPISNTSAVTPSSIN